MPNFGNGIDEAEERGLAANIFYRLDQVTFEKGKPPVYLRFVTEQVITGESHRYIPTKDKPQDCDWTKWPSMMWGICPRDKMFRVYDSLGNPTDDFEEGYGDCYIHTAYAGVKDPKYGKDLGKPEVLTYGLAALRKVRYDPGTRRAIGFEDETMEYRDKEGVTHTVPKLVIVSYYWNGLWAPIKASAFLPPYSICDKDFSVQRKDDGKLTVSALPPTDDLKPGTRQWERYEQAIAITGASLEQYIVDHSTPDHYRRFFIPGQSPEGGYSRGGGTEDDSAKGGKGETSPADVEIDQEALAKLRAEMSPASRGTE